MAAYPLFGEVNLLPDHLVDVILDTVAMGVNRVEREGISFSHEARVILVGTMNPEEGELRPQLLDRFGLCATVDPLASVDVRKIAMQRRIEYDRNPKAFSERFAGEQQLLAQRIRLARQILPDVTVPESVLELLLQKTTEAVAPRRTAQGRSGRCIVPRAQSQRGISARS